jgi:hypothetical protein
MRNLLVVALLGITVAVAPSGVRQVKTPPLHAPHRRGYAGAHRYYERPCQKCVLR